MVFEVVEQLSHVVSPFTSFYSMERLPGLYDLTSNIDLQSQPSAGRLTVVAWYIAHQQSPARLCPQANEMHEAKAQSLRITWVANF